MNLENFKGVWIDVKSSPQEIRRGLMFKKPHPTLFIMPHCKKWKFHTWFCLPMDIVFLDNTRVVADVYENCRPFKVATATRPCRYVIECPPHTWREIVEVLK